MGHVSEATDDGMAAIVRDENVPSPKDVAAHSAAAAREAEAAHAMGDLRIEAAGEGGETRAGGDDDATMAPGGTDGAESGAGAGSGDVAGVTSTADPSSDSGGARMDIFVGVDEYVSGAVLSFLTATDLCAAAAVSPRWRAIVEVFGDDLWKALCVARWEGKHRMLPAKLPSETNLTHPRAGLRVGARDLKRILRDRRIDARHALEKKELVALLQSAASMPMHTLAPRFAASLPWKAAYAAAEASSRVSDPLRLEDIAAEGLKWRFEFKNRRDIYFVAQFHPDFTYTSNMQMHEGQSLPWSFYGTDSVQVASYPPLKASRRKEDWGWMLENSYVEFFSIDETTGGDQPYPAYRRPPPAGAGMW